MSYLRGPLTRDQIATLSADEKSSRRPCRAGPAPAAASRRPERRHAERGRRATEQLPGRCRRRHAGAPDGRHRGRCRLPRGRQRDGDGRSPRRARGWPPRRSSSARITYKDTRADVDHDEEVQAILTPLAERVDLAVATEIRRRDRRRHERATGRRGVRAARTRRSRSGGGGPRSNGRGSISSCAPRRSRSSPTRS